MEKLQNNYVFNTGGKHASLSSSIIITPYEKVLTILNNVKHYINVTSKHQSKLIRSLDWVIKVITSHSLYAYELKEKDLINKLSKENVDFKNFVDFVSKYNEQVIEMNKKNVILGARTIEVANDLLLKPSLNLKKNLKSPKNAYTPTKKNDNKIKLNKSYKITGKNVPYFFSNRKKSKILGFLENTESKRKMSKINTNNILNTLNINTPSQNIPKFSKSGNNLRFEKILSMTKFGNLGNVMKKNSEPINNQKTFYIDINKLNTSKINNRNIRKSFLPFNTNSIDSKDFKDNNNTVESFLYNNSTSSEIDSFTKERLSLPFNSFNTLTAFSLQGMINEPFFNPRLIMEKEFNIFD